MFSGVISSDASKMGGNEFVSDSSSIMVGMGLEGVGSIVLLSVRSVDWWGVGVGGIVVWEWLGYLGINDGGWRNTMVLWSWDDVVGLSHC